MEQLQSFRERAEKRNQMQMKLEELREEKKEIQENTRNTDTGMSIMARKLRNPGVTLAKKT